MHAQWPYMDCLHADSDLYTIHCKSVCVCECVSLDMWCSSHSESVTAESILHRRVRQHHVGITEHAQSVQAEGLDAQLVLQREAYLWVKTFGHRGERTADVLGQTGVGVIWEREAGNAQWSFCLDQKEIKKKHKSSTGKSHVHESEFISLSVRNVSTALSYSLLSMNTENSRSQLRDIY